MLDTHFLIWLADDPSVLSRAERSLLGGTGHDFAVSVASVWEVRLKWDARNASGKRKGIVSPESVLDLIYSLNFRIVPITERHAAARLDVPMAHKDPFDELLLVQAQVEGMRLLTRDTLLVDHPLAYLA